MNNQLRLILLAHGSRDPNWRQQFEKLQERAVADLGNGKVDLAYMEFHGPSLDDTARKAWSEGIRQIRVLPLFLASGAHIARDIPEQVELVKRQCPGMNVEVRPPIGDHPRLRSVLNEIIQEESLRLEIESVERSGANTA